uniref:Reverse transcriptase domain-containing protein n=1 Tax=Chenopodium quinoa TaxID=63459 RepID=A0A803MRA4_CHEQI
MCGIESKSIFTDQDLAMSNAIPKNSKNGIEGVISTYFGKLFASDNPSEYEAAVEGIKPLVIEDMRRELEKEPTGEEIRVALFQMHPNKAPGPDGMHALFFQKFWSTVGNDVIRFVKEWWRGEVNLDEVNRTCIVLIPKCDDPVKMTEFRPISLCNVLYKTISKTLANKMKGILGSIISINQSAFAPNHLITDNALVAFEVFHYMKRKREGRDDVVALKLDMSGILKERYYKKSDFMEAARGHDPSYSWRSIWGSKSLLLDGLKWRVGNGSSIKVWEDAWIDGDFAHFVPTPPVNYDGSPG